MLSGLRAVVSAEGEHGENMIREDEAGFTVMLRRPIRDLRRQLPNIEVCPQACCSVEFGKSSLEVLELAGNFLPETSSGLLGIPYL